jgi:hypothetical protein
MYPASLILDNPKQYETKTAEEKKTGQGIISDVRQK